MNAADRLSDIISEKERRIDELEAQIENSKYEDEWRWRQIRKLTLKENLGLPLPRLEMRYRKHGDYNVIADYGLVHKHLFGDIIFIPFSSTRIGGVSACKEDFLELPFRDGAHIQNEMWDLKLPGYVVNGTHYKEISNKDRRDIPSALLKKMGAQK